jgi:hypothetical protein
MLRKRQKNERDIGGKKEKGPSQVDRGPSIVRSS